MQRLRAILYSAAILVGVGIYWGVWTLALAMTYFLHGRSTHPAIEAALVTVVTILVVLVWRGLDRKARTWFS